jgi:hypothetical protein
VLKQELLTINFWARKSVRKPGEGSLSLSHAPFFSILNSSSYLSMLKNCLLFLGLCSLPVVSFSQATVSKNAAAPELTLSVGHSDRFATVISDDAKIMITYTDKIIKIWSVDAGRLLRNIELEYIKSVEFDKTSKNILVTWQNDVKIFSVATGKQLDVSFAHRNIRNGVFSSAKNFVITTGNDSTVRVWNPAGKLLGLVPIRSDAWRYDQGQVNWVQLNEKTNRLLTVTDSLSILWNWTTKSEIIRFSHGGILSPSGKFLLIPAVNDSALMKLHDGITGKEILALDNTNASTYAWEFSPDEKHLSGMFSTRGELTGVWSTSSGKRIFHSGFMPCSGSYESFGCDQPMYLISSSTFDPKSTVLTVTGLRYPSNNPADSTWSWFIKTHDLQTGRVVDSVYNICDQGLVFDTHPIFSSDGKWLFTSYSDQSKQMDSGVIVYDALTKKVLQKIGGGNFELKDATISTGGERLIITTDDEFPPVVYDIETGARLAMLKEENPYRWPTVNKFSGDHTKALSFYSFGDPIFWNTTTGDILKVFKNGPARNTRYAVSHHTDRNSTHAFFSYRYTTGNSILVNLANPENIIPYNDGFSAFSDDGSHFAYYKEGLVLIQKSDSLNTQATPIDISRHLADFNIGETTPVVPVSGQLTPVNPGDNVEVRVSNDGKIITLEDWAGTFVIEPGKNRLLKRFYGRKTISFGPNGKFFIVVGETSVRNYSTTNGNNYTWDVPILNLADSVAGLYSLNALISPDNSRVLLKSSDRVIVLNAATGERIRQVKFKGKFKEVNWTRNIVISTYESQMIVTSLVTGKLLLIKTFLGPLDWVVTHPTGLFDATQGAMQNLYFVQNTDIIQFDQLKDRYYEPGLWKKVMKGEDLRQTTGLKAIDLPPDVRITNVDAQGYINIELINRGGGIGEVSVFIQGKEVAKDARTTKTPDASSMKIRYFVGKHKNLVDGDNLIAVKAWNKDHWVVSRSEAVTFTKSEVDSIQPAVHILACGISDYAGGKDIDLAYAAKDAEDIASSLAAGANRLFGTTRTNLYKLTTSGTKETWPTKKNIISIFNKIAAAANPRDVIVVYLSGHGTNIGGAEGDWHYLTQEAYTVNGSAYNDPAIRQQTTLSSNELVEMFKKIPAAKQVLVIDACASGKVVDNLIVKRDVPSSTLRALDRMKDRIGLHIITGCTADAVSYEASRYGQGVLTYSLLEGIRGAALRDNEFVDVNRLFQYAQERVPVLATGIGGIQTPVTFSPNGSQSFDIGQLNDDEKKKIPISQIRPVYIQSNFQDEDEMSDVIGLGKKVDELLSDEATRGVAAPVIFVPVREYPDGCQLVGRYKKENDVISLKLRKRCGGTDQTITVSGKTTEELSVAVINSVKN